MILHNRKAHQNNLHTFSWVLQHRTHSSERLTQNSEWPKWSPSIRQAAEGGMAMASTSVRALTVAPRGTMPCKKQTFAEQMQDCNKPSSVCNATSLFLSGKRMLDSIWLVRYCKPARLFGKYFQNFSFCLMQWSVIKASHVSQHSTLHQGANKLWHCLLPVVSQLLYISLVDTKQTMKFWIQNWALESQVFWFFLTTIELQTDSTYL